MVKKFQRTLLLLSIPIASIMIPLTVWMVTSRSNSRGKKEALVQEMETEDGKTDNMENFKDEILIEAAMHQLAVSNFLATPAVSFSEAKCSSFYLYCIKFKMGSTHHHEMQAFNVNTKLYWISFVRRYECKKIDKNMKFNNWPLDRLNNTRTLIVICN